MDCRPEKNIWYILGIKKQKNIIISKIAIFKWKWKVGRHWNKTYENFQHFVRKLKISAPPIHEQAIYFCVLSNGKQLS